LTSTKVGNITVEDIMTKNPITINSKCTISEAAKLMSKNKIGSIIVVDENNNPIGIITERDLVVKVIAEDKDPRKTIIEEIMSKPVISVNSKTKLIDAARIMAKRGIRRLVVIDEGKLKGIITSRDILKVAPEIIDILIESAKITEPIEGSITEVEVIAGYCDECGEWSESLREIEGKLLCPECKLSYQGQ